MTVLESGQIVRVNLTFRWLSQTTMQVLEVAKAEFEQHGDVMKLTAMTLSEADIPPGVLEGFEQDYPREFSFLCLAGENPVVIMENFSEIVRALRPWIDFIYSGMFETHGGTRIDFVTPLSVEFKITHPQHATRMLRWGHHRRIETFASLADGRLLA